MFREARLAEYDLVVRNGTVATAADVYRADIGIAGGRIIAIAERLPKAESEIDATDRLVLPGGVDSHCHIYQHSLTGAVFADDFRSGSISAAWCGTTTISPFAAPPKGHSL